MADARPSPIANDFEAALALVRIGRIAHRGEAEASVCELDKIRPHNRKVGKNDHPAFRSKVSNMSDCIDRGSRRELDREWGLKIEGEVQCAGAPVRFEGNLSPLAGIEHGLPPN